MEICVWVIGILIILFTLRCSVWNVFRLFCFVKCFKKTDCTDERCHLKHCCNKWAKTCTEKDKRLINKLIEELEADEKNISREPIKQKKFSLEIVDDIMFIALCLAALSFIGTAVWIIARGIMIKFH